MKIDYSVQLTTCPDGERFGWSIYQGENELGHSAGSFGTRIEALMTECPYGMASGWSPAG